MAAALARAPAASSGPASGAQRRGEGGEFSAALASAASRREDVVRSEADQDREEPARTRQVVVDAGAVPPEPVSRRISSQEPASRPQPAAKEGAVGTERASVREPASGREAVSDDGGAPKIDGLEALEAATNEAVAKQHKAGAKQDGVGPQSAGRTFAAASPAQPRRGAVDAGRLREAGAGLPDAGLVDAPMGAVGAADAGATDSGATEAGATEAWVGARSASWPPLESAQRALLDPAQRAPLESAQRAQLESAQRASLDPAQRAPLDPGQRAPLDPGQRAPLDPTQRAPLDRLANAAQQGAPLEGPVRTRNPHPVEKSTAAAPLPDATPPDATARSASPHEDPSPAASSPPQAAPRPLASRDVSPSAETQTVRRDEMRRLGAHGLETPETSEERSSRRETSSGADRSENRRNDFQYSLPNTDSKIGYLDLNVDPSSPSSRVAEPAAALAESGGKGAPKAEAESARGSWAATQDAPGRARLVAPEAPETAGFPPQRLFPGSAQSFSQTSSEPAVALSLRRLWPAPPFAGRSAEPAGFPHRSTADPQAAVDPAEGRLPAPGRPYFATPSGAAGLDSPDHAPASGGAAAAAPRDGMPGRGAEGSPPASSQQDVAIPPASPAESRTATAPGPRGADTTAQTAVEATAGDKAETSSEAGAKPWPSGGPGGQANAGLIAAPSLASAPAADAAGREAPTELKASQPSLAAGRLAAPEPAVEAAALRGAAGRRDLNLVVRAGELGRVSVRIVERAGQLSAVLRSENPRAAQVLSDNVPALLESLSERGLGAESRQAGAGAYDSEPHDQQRRHRQQRQQGRRRIRLEAAGRSFGQTIRTF